MKSTQITRQQSARMFETRSEDALHSFGTSRELIIAELTGYALDKIEREMAIRKITDPGSEAFVMMMRSLGGFSKIIGEAINEEPQQMPNSLGIPDNSGWWLWHVKVQCIEAVREKVQTALSSAARTALPKIKVSSGKSNANGVIVIENEVLAFVDGKCFGPFNDIGSAKAGLEVEERRSAGRRHSSVVILSHPEPAAARLPIGSMRIVEEQEVAR